MSKAKAIAGLFPGGQGVPTVTRTGRRGKIGGSDKIESPLVILDSASGPAS
jgi:hypothetical protein